MAGAGGRGSHHPPALTPSRLGLGQRHEGPPADRSTRSGDSQQPPLCLISRPTAKMQHPHHPSRVHAPRRYTVRRAGVLPDLWAGFPAPPSSSWASCSDVADGGLRPQGVPGTHIVPSHPNTVPATSPVIPTTTEVTRIHLKEWR